MKQSAIDCKINLYDNEEEGLGCIALDGGFKEYAFHPLLKQDIILTKEEYPDEDAGTTVTAAPVAAAAAASVPLPDVKPKVNPKVEIKGLRLKMEDGTEFYAYPENGQVPAMSYILYAWDESFRRKAPDSSSTVLGRTGAKKDGSISWVGLTWSR